MPEFTSPSEIARETLRRLAAQRLAPTPDHYRSTYHQIAGSKEEDNFPGTALRAIAKALPRNTPEALKLAQQFEHATNSGSWPMMRRAILALAAAERAESEQLMSRLLHPAVSALLTDVPALSAEARALALAVESATANELEVIAQRLDAFIRKLEWAGEDQHAVRESLLALLRLILQNISELVLDDRWLHGQLSVLSEAFAGPLDIRVL